MVKAMKKIKQAPFLLILTLALLLQATHATGAPIKAEVSRNPVTVDETFELTFETDGSPNGDPDFGPLKKDFDILHRGQSQNIQMVNGRYSRTTRWTLSLMAKTIGKLKIPPISFGNDRSNAVAIQVWGSAKPKPTQSGKDLFMEVAVEPKTAYVGQQLIYHVRLYRSVNITDPSLTAPKFNDPDVMVEQLGNEQAYETQRHGKNYLVSQIDYAVFPQTSGTLALEPLVFQARVVQHPHGRGRFRTPFDMFDQAGVVKRIRSKALSIEVQPIPNGAQKPWLPASNLQLSASWPKSNPKFRVGEPATRTLTLVADGLMSAQLPEISHDIPAGFKQYPDQPVLEDRENSNHITGVRQEKIALVPTKPGLHTLPAVEITWWNTATNQQEVARVPELQIEVLPAVDTVSEPKISTPVPKKATATTGAQNIEMPPTLVETDPATGVETKGGLYRWLSLFLALGWVATAIAWWQLGGRQKPAQNATADSETAPTKKSKKQCLSDLKQACDNNNAQAARLALMAWCATQWTATPPRGLTDITMRLKGKAAQQIKILERALYGKDENSWEGMALYEAIQDYKPKQPVDEETSDSLAPLYLS